jgi:hypothetical protein
MCYSVSKNKPQHNKPQLLERPHTMDPEKGRVVSCGFGFHASFLHRINYVPGRSNTRIHKSSELTSGVIIGLRRHVQLLVGRSLYFSEPLG